MTKKWLLSEPNELKRNGFGRVILKKVSQRTMETWKACSIYAVLIAEPIMDRTRFSMLTGDRAESSIHDFIPEREDMSGNRDQQIAELKAQLDNVLDHVYFYHIILINISSNRLQLIARVEKQIFLLKFPYSQKIPIALYSN